MKKIILVDDIKLHLLTTRDRLKGRYEVYPAQSAEKMFEILEKITPDLILLDINMPGINGFETLKNLKSNSRFAGIPVIFLTSRDDRKSMIKGMSLGAVDYISKPYSDSILIERIENQLNPEKCEMNKPVILTVDDSPVVLKEVSKVLSDQYRVYTLREPEKIEELLSMITPDMFLLDYKMPKITGFDLVPIIRNNPRHSETPIIFLTSEGTVDNISVAIHLGACDFIVKPVDISILREKIATHISGYSIRRRVSSVK